MPWIENLCNLRNVRGHHIAYYIFFYSARKFIETKGRLNLKKDTTFTYSVIFLNFYSIYRELGIH